MYKLLREGNIDLKYDLIFKVIKMSAPVTDSVREKALADYRKKLLEHKELEARLKESMFYIYIKHYTF